MSNNNGTGFWVIVALIAALSFVAILEAAIAAGCALGRQIDVALRRVIARRQVNSGRNLAA